jgi:hypothetical protein
MNTEKLSKFVSRLCRKNLNSNRVKCCADCPFEEEIVKEFPELKEKFEQKRNFVYGTIKLS